MKAARRLAREMIHALPPIIEEIPNVITTPTFWFVTVSAAYLATIATLAT